MSPNAYDIITQDPKMRELIALAEKMARTAGTVLITGPTGTGKELLARHIHVCSGRSGAFVTYNCGRYTESMVEDDLFGHEAGAFTNATASRPGCFERANRGTLFLDEIQRMEPRMQNMLMRVLEDKLVQRVGGTKSTPVDVKIVAATNVDLKQAVRAGRFAADAYQRLAELTLDLPRLSERKGDIPLLVRHFTRNRKSTPGSEPVEITEEAMWLLVSHTWPENVRELRNVVGQLIVRCRPGAIDAKSALSLIGPPRGIKVRPFWLCRAQAYVRALLWAGHKLKLVAKWFGVHPDTVTRTIAKIDRDAYIRELVPGDVQSSVVEERVNVRMAIESARGNVARAAELLEMDPATLGKWLKQNPEVAIEECRVGAQIPSATAGAVRPGAADFSHGR